MTKRIHYLSRETVSTLSNRRVGIGLCGQQGRSLKNYTRDVHKVTCRNCERMVFELQVNKSE